MWCNFVYVWKQCFSLHGFAKQTLYFVLPAATAAESQHAPVCSGAEWPPDRHTTAACSGHHLTDAAGTTEYVHHMQCWDMSKIIYCYWNLFCKTLNSHTFLCIDILQAQNLLNQLPQSQANLLPTPSSISLAPQVMMQAPLWTLRNCNSVSIGIDCRVIFCHVFAACNSNPHNSSYTYSDPAPQSDTT